MDRVMREKDIAGYAEYLKARERSSGTIEKYIRDVGVFYRFLPCDKGVDKSRVAAFKAGLQQRYAAATVNSMLAAVNGFLKFMKWDECSVNLLRLQRRIFCEESRSLSRQDYEKLLRAAKEAGKSRLLLMMETICGTGIRVSELKYVTVEAAKEGRAEISLKGKTRSILFPSKLRRKLLDYARRERVQSGSIFRTRSGAAISRGQVWAEMKGLCEKAGIPSAKVFPHNLRRLFARCFYSLSRDVAKLADLLGHSSIETTRIYLMSTGQEHMSQLEKLKLIS